MACIVAPVEESSKGVSNGNAGEADLFPDPLDDVTCSIASAVSLCRASRSRTSFVSMNCSCAVNAAISTTTPLLLPLSLMFRNR